MVASLPSALVRLATGLSVVLLASPALAQYPQDAAIAGASDTTVRAGQRVIIGGEGWEPGSRVLLTWQSANLGRAEIDGDGEFSATVSVPLRSRGGEQFVRVKGVSGTGQASEITIRMLVDGATSPGNQVSFTSANITLWGLLALAFFLVGIWAVIRGRRRSLGST